MRAPHMHIHKRTLYGNVVGIGGWQAHDFKVKVGGGRDWPFLSTSDASFRAQPVGAYIRERFPDPSPYEVVE